MRQAGLRGITRAKGPPTTIPCTGPDTRPCCPGLSRRAARSVVGRRHPVLPDVRRLGLRRLRHRRVQPAGRRLAAIHQPAHRSGPRRAGNGSVDSPARRPPDQRAHPPLGQGSSVRRSALHPAPRGGRRGRLGRVDRRFLRHSLAEAFNSLFNAELVRNKGPWKNIDDFEIAVAEYIDWFNHRRLHGGIGTVPPAELEQQHYRHHHAPATAGASVLTLH